MIFFLIGYACGIGYFTTAAWSMAIDLVVWTGLFWLMGFWMITGFRDLYDKETGTGIIAALFGGAAGGGSVFMFAWFFFGWNRSIWYYFLFLLLGLIAFWIPGGYTLLLYGVVRLGMAYQVPFWGFVLTAAMDVLSLAACIRFLVSGRKSREITKQYR